MGKEEDRRKYRRVFKALLAKMTYPRGECYGYVHNLAKFGFGVTCNERIEITEEVDIDLKVPPKQVLRLFGRVVWQKMLPPQAKNRYILGIKLANPPKEYSSYIDSLIKQEDELLAPLTKKE